MFSYPLTVLNNNMFYVIVNNNATLYEFSYIDGEEPKSLDPTLIPGMLREGPKYKKEAYDLFARNLMSKNIISALPGDDLRCVKTLMAQNHINHIPVIDGEKILGLISSNDIFLNHSLKNEDLVYSFMNGAVLCASEETPLVNILKVFINENIHSILIVNEEKKLTGILTQNDIFKWLISEALKT